MLNSLLVNNGRGECAYFRGVCLFFSQIIPGSMLIPGGTLIPDPRVHTLVDIHLRTARFEQNILGYYSGTTQDSETNDTSFESIIIELLEMVMKEGVAVS